MKADILISLLAIVISYDGAVTAKELNNRPIIAVLAMRYPKDSDQSYIAASYVKYLEMAGARVVPIPHHFSASKVKSIFKHVNGVLYPGGAARWFTSDYYKHAKQFFDLAVAANDDGDYFPVWGTCLGIEALHIIQADKKVTRKRPASDLSYPLNYTRHARNSRLFKGMSDELFSTLGREELSYNHHKYGISPATYKSHPLLRDFFKVLSTNVGENGRVFISTIEAYDYPIYGVQWHPEKIFEFTKKLKNIPHSENAILVTQYMANFFVNEARRNFHRFPSKKMEDEYLIYKYNPVHSALKWRTGSLRLFEQVYLF